MSLKSILAVMAVILAFGAAASASEQTRQITVVQEMAPQGDAIAASPGPAGPVPTPYPNAGALRSLSQVKDTNALFAGSRGGDRGSGHVGGMQVGLADGSVRSGDQGAGIGLAAQGQSSAANQNPPPPPPPPPKPPASPLPVLLVIADQHDFQTAGKGLAATGAPAQAKSPVGGNQTQTIGAGHTATVKGARSR